MQLKMPLTARYCVKKWLKMLIYWHVNCAFSPFFALSRTRQRLFQQHVRAITFLACLSLALPLSAAMDDPTRPPTADTKISHVVKTKKSQRPRWVLTSTLVSAGRRTAVINDRVVSRGDRVNGATVVNIQPATVRLRARGRDVTLVMLKRKIKSLSRQQTSRQPLLRQGK
jgi:hypothetical protein